MGKTLSAWLELRESADTAARSEPLTNALAHTFDPGSPLAVLDLGTGTGSNIRFLLERLVPQQHWLALDRDASLLTELVARTSSWARARGYDTHATSAACVLQSATVTCSIETRQLDLGNLRQEIFDGRHLVTASALLDLASTDWLRALAACCRTAGASALFALTYDGRSWCTPMEPEDDLVRTLLNRHQKRDKGLGGPADGPEAAASAERAFSEEGFLVHCEASEWKLGHNHEALQAELVEGWFHAAVEVAPELAATLSHWHTRRLDHLRHGRSTIVVGHQDIAAVHPDRRR
jgi:hypothetical protein